MKISVYGKNSPAFSALLNEFGFVTVPPEQSELVVTYGGDGSFLEAVRLFPGRSIFPIRDEETAPHCEAHPVRKSLESLLQGTVRETRLPVIACSMNGKTVLKGINDIFFHNLNPVSALRCKVRIGEELFVPELIGDGAGVSTVHGATAYYRNITGSLFRTGIGLAFVNSSEAVDHIVLPENSVVRFRLTRGSARIIADNNPAMLKLAEGNEFFIALTDETVSVLGLEMFMCSKCRFLRHQQRYEFLKEEKK